MNHRHWTIAIATGATALGLSMQATAHDPRQFDQMAAPHATAAAPLKMEKFSDLDKNGDGYLTAVELPVTHMLRQHFTTADSNGDTRVSEAEVQAHHAAMAPKK